MSEPPAADVLIAHDSGDVDSVEFLATALDRAGIRPLLFDERALPELAESPITVLGSVRALVLGVARTLPPDWMPPLAGAARRAADGVERPVFVALFRSAREGVAEKLDVPSDAVLDLRGGPNENVVAGAVERIRSALDGPSEAAPPVEQSAAQQAPEPDIPPNISKMGPPPSPSPTEQTITEIWDALDPRSIDALAQADAVSKRRNASQLHSEDLLIGLYRESDGPTIQILRDANVSARDVARMVAKQIPSVRPAARLRRVPQLEFAPSFSRHSYSALQWAFDAAKTEGPAGKITTRHILAGLVSLTDCSVAQELRDAGLTPEDVLAWRPPEPEPGALGIPEALAGFRSDTTGGPDLLNIGPEVDAIATVLAARTVDPPLALGLFGDWGTGKTFFMDELDKRIAVLAAREAAADRHGDDRIYCRNIVQLRFNAWHYIDENLWASLANAIFEGLDDALATQHLNARAIESRGKERAGLLLERAQAEKGLEEARHEQADADRLADEAQANVDRVDERYDELVQAVRPEAILAGGLKVAMAQPEVADQVKTQKDNVNAKVDEAAKELGIKPETLHNALAGSTANGYVAAWRALLHDSASRVWVPIAALAVLAVVVAVALDAAGFDSAALVGAGVSLLVGIAGGLRPLIEAGGRVSRVIAEAREEGEALVEAEREKVRKQALADKEKRDQEAAVAAAKVQARADALDGVDQRLSQLRPGREMADFVRVRQSSNEYKSRLGIVARARDDFEELSRLLAKDRADNEVPVEAAKAAGDGAGENGAGDPKAIERIILYIDDLDRCKEKDVVAVLQAVHLLLAFPLFVVVVAVDPRWLLHSLRVESNVLGGDQQGFEEDEEDGLGWEATPLNYLEKIFQIPFALRPMGRSGFGAIIDNLVGHKPSGPAAKSTNGRGEAAGLEHVGGQATSGDAGNGAGPSASPPADGHVPSEKGAEPDVTATADQADQEAAAPQEHGPAEQESEEERPVEMNPRSLDISEDERLYMAGMHPLIGTPRGAKRFVNVYRLLKASHPVPEQGEFGQPEVHRPVLLLLAALTGFPRETAEILRVLVEDEPDGPWWDFVLEFAKQAAAETKAKDSMRSASWEQLLGKLRQVRATEPGEMSCADVRKRARRVARYSFESSRILFMEAEEPEGLTGSGSEAPSSEPVLTSSA